MAVNRCFKIGFVLLSALLVLLLQTDLFQTDVEEQPVLVVEVHNETPKRSHGVKQTVRSNATKNIQNNETDNKGHDSSALVSRPPSWKDPSKSKLSDFINPKTYEVKADLSHIIDFAMIGNPKTGTTFMAAWMRKHPDLLDPKPEMRAMRFDKGPGRSLEVLFPLYQQKKPSQKLGYKCPADVREIRALRNLRDYFPKTKLIVGIRHPVWWFQSFHNYRVRDGFEVPSPLKTRGECVKKMVNTCTYNAYFHLFLAQMGRTSLSTKAERDLLRHYSIETLEPLPYDLTVMNPPANHPIFLYEQSQIDGRKVPEIAEALRQDLSAYLELETPLPSLRQAEPRSHHDNSTATTSGSGHTRHLSEIVDICEPQYQSVRDELTLIGRDAAEWIVKYFMDLPLVQVSSPDYFRQALEEYQQDPCVKEEANA